MSAAAAAITTEGADDREKAAFKATFNTALAQLYQMSKTGGGRIVSVTDVAHIRGVLQGFDTMSTEQKRQQGAYDIRKRYSLGVACMLGNYRAQDVLQLKDGKLICPWEEAFDAIKLVHENRKSTLHSRAPFYGAAQLTPF